VLLAELLEGHDHTKFEIYGYDYSPEDGSAHRERLKKAFDHLRNIKTLTDRQVAEQIMSDEIDFLIDMHGLSSGARPGIFALHPAPKQATYLGYMGTTGMPWFDFVIADRCSLPEELTKYYTEKPLYVEGTFIPLTKEDATLREVKRSEFGLPSDAFVLAAFGNVYKITPEMFVTWMNILKACPKAILWLLDDNPTTTANLKKQCGINGVDDKQIIFTPRTSPSEYKLKLRVADVFLDNYPYNCGSTTNDIINSFTPIVTMTGKSLVSKMGKSILEQFELRELIANDKNEYMKIIFNLYNNPELITKIKEKIKNRLNTLNRLTITKSIENIQVYL
jgi:predicted O-linked N-acetylglucosamine transferase (SPINDLY family)